MGTAHSFGQVAQYRAKALSELPLVARHRELAKLMGFVRANMAALIHGGSGLGKTRLLLEIKRALEAEAVKAIYLRFRQPLHLFLVEAATQLDLSVSHDSSVNLRGALWKAFELEPRVVLLDDIADPSPAYYRFFEQLVSVKGNVLLGAAAHFHATGSLQRIFWNQQTAVPLAPLNKRDASVLAESAVQTFLFGRSPSQDFCERVVQAARGNPGRIVEMCVRGGDPRYRTADDHIRFGALVMDSVAGLVP